MDFCRFGGGLVQRKYYAKSVKIPLLPTKKDWGSLVQLITYLILALYFPYILQFLITDLIFVISSSKKVDMLPIKRRQGLWWGNTSSWRPQDEASPLHHYRGCYHRPHLGPRYRCTNILTQSLSWFWFIRNRLNQFGITKIYWKSKLKFQNAATELE